jgi:excisionase family DNA binding protein
MPKKSQLLTQGDNNTLPTTSPATSNSEATSRKFRKASVVAAQIGVNKKTIFRWADRGHIHRFQLNRRLVLFDPAEVAAFIEQSRV